MPRSSRPDYDSAFVLGIERAICPRTAYAVPAFMGLSALMSLVIAVRSHTQHRQIRSCHRNTWSAIIAISSCDVLASAVRRCAFSRKHRQMIGFASSLR